MKEETRKSKIKLSKILTVFIRAFLFLILIILLFLILCGFIYVGDLLYNVKTGEKSNPLFRAYVVVTESMVPTINVNDAVIVRRVDDEMIDIGDIITFAPSSGYYFGSSITHRIVGKEVADNGDVVYRTKGDNNDREDLALVYHDNIYGKVILRLPMIGYIKSFVLSPDGFVISIIVPVFLVLVYEAFRIFNLYNRRNKEIEII